MMARHMTREEILHLGTLSRITLSDEEIERFQGEFADILHYVDELKDVTDDGTAQEEKVVGLHHNVLREDGEPHEARAYTDALLKAAPDRDGQYVRVKKILQDG